MAWEISETWDVEMRQELLENCSRLMNAFYDMTTNSLLNMELFVLQKYQYLTEPENAEATMEQLEKCVLYQSTMYALHTGEHHLELHQRAGPHELHLASRVFGKIDRRATGYA